MAEGWCYEHNCPFCMIPANGQWHYACPECFKTVEVYTTNRVVVQTRGTTPIYDMMVHGVPETEVGKDDP